MAKYIVRYVLRYDYTTESYNNESQRTEDIETKTLEWDGETNLIDMIKVKEADFLTKDHPDRDMFSWDHRNHRIEVAGVWLVDVPFTLSAPCVIKAEPKAA